MQYKKIIIGALIAVVAFTMGCKKDYYEDTGVHTPTFNGTIMQYLEAKPEYFDSVIKVIKLAGMEDVFKKEDITFFAPADSSIRRTLAYVNLRQEFLGKPLVTRLEQIKPEVWRRQLSRYVFKEKKAMNDFRQIDTTNLSAYPGQIYSSYDGLLMNVGVIYDDAGGVKYAGYRHLQLSFIPSASAPRDFASWYSADVASVNIAPTNGYVHVLKYPFHYFGFSQSAFFEDAYSAGIEP